MDAKCPHLPDSFHMPHDIQPNTYESVVPDDYCASLSGRISEKAGQTKHSVRVTCSTGAANHHATLTPQF